MNKTASLYKKTGFTLIEVIMAIVLIGIVATVVAMTVYQGARAFGQAGARGDLTEEARLAIDRMSKELMFARCLPAGAACAPVGIPNPAKSAARMGRRRWFRVRMRSSREFGPVTRRRAGTAR